MRDRQAHLSGETHACNLSAVCLQCLAVTAFVAIRYINKVHTTHYANKTIFQLRPNNNSQYSLSLTHFYVREKLSENGSKTER